MIRPSASGKLLLPLLIAAAALHGQAENVPAPPAASGAVTTAAVQALPERYRTWLAEVDPLILLPERRLFVSLEHDYQRDAFIEAFWKVRDPYPRTARNELKEKWPQRVASARANYGGLDDDRSRILLIHGDPESTYKVRCSAARSPAELWVYRGTDWLDLEAALLFVQPMGRNRAKLWRPGAGPSVDDDLNRLRDCFNGEQIVEIAESLRENRDYQSTLEAFLAKPRPSSVEWVASFAAFSTELAPGQTPLAGAALELDYPGRFQQRTVVQGLLALPRESAQVGDYAGYRSYELRLVGEVLADGKLFESFRYQFSVPEASAPERLPLAFQRLLRPGDYRLHLKLEDLSSGRALRFERELQVPVGDGEIARPSFQDPATEKIFAEATAALRQGETSVRLIPPQSDQLLVGPTRFDTLVTGPVEKVRFALEDKVLLTRNNPPYNVEVDLGAFPEMRTLAAVGLDAAGAEIARDELLLNSGGYRFVVKLREPQPGRTFDRSVQARVEVEVPRGRSLERVELYLGEKRVATLFQEPFVQPLILPKPGATTYVRAVAYLADGQSAEDLVFVNGQGNVDEINVDLVELYAAVFGRDGRPLGGLAQNDFQVLEDGVPQTLSRFDQVENLPVHVGFVIDNSASMVGTLDEVRRAVLGFFEKSLRQDDRAAVITFNNAPRLAVELTQDRRALGAGLAGLQPEGRTALYDSVMFGLYYFAGIKGQRALLILSDGKDEGSRFDFDQTLDYARRAGITLYPIGLRLDDLGARTRLERLAQETGGSAFFVREVAQVEGVYATIEKELRSQLLLAYQSNSRSPEGQFRRIELKVDRPGAVVKTLSGYYP